jgi:peptide/nickel transport system permease protein
MTTLNDPAGPLPPAAGAAPPGAVAASLRGAVRSAHARFIALRLAALAGLLLVLSLVLFALQQVSGTDPIAAMLGANASHSQILAVRHQLGYDQPVTVQYLHYLSGLLHGNLGTSFRTRHPVSDDIATFLPPTVELVAAALVVALLLGAAFAVSSAARWPGTGIFRGLLLVGATTPVFLLGIAGLILLYQDLGWLPAGGQVTNPDSAPGGTGFLLIDALTHGQPAVFADALKHLILPAVALGTGPAVAIGRVFGAGISQTLSSDYVRTARAQGLTEPSVLRHHVLRNAVNGALSMTGLQIGFMFAGTVVVEGIFSWPGLGSYVEASISASDFPAVAGVTFVFAGSYIVVNALVDILQSLADPRIAL